MGFEQTMDNLFLFVQTICTEVNFMDKKTMEKLQQKKNQGKFNSVTQKSKPENQNQTHNVKSEGVEAKIRQI